MFMFAFSDDDVRLMLWTATGFEICVFEHLKLSVKHYFQEILFNKNGSFIFGALGVTDLK